METTIHRFSHRLLPISINPKLKPFKTPKQHDPILFLNQIHNPISSKLQFLNLNPSKQTLNLNVDNYCIHRRGYRNSSAARAGWLLGLGEKKQILPEIVKAGDPVLHEPAREVPAQEMGSEKIEKIIEDMVKVMRKAPGVGLAAPQIGIPLRIIVLEDTKEYISYQPKEEIKAQDRRPFDLLVILNPVLKKKSNRTALFFEGCLSVDGFRAMVERYLNVEVEGVGRDGRPIKVEASGWQARILQHECDHLDGTLYVDKMVPRTFRTVENLDLPLANGCPKLGTRKAKDL
ncbi:Peptide deformylase [Dillenia turbinata]|uniref:Peptide deformylase n=1 Tax=Dillenia turbinata TaxID=194707 RepID=A0AAN8YTN3_9MAGN